MVSSPVPGFITKKDAAEQYQRSHRQLTRDLSDAMKVQDAKVLESCRLRTEDGQIVDGLGLTPEIIDQLCVEGKNPVWYVRISWLEKTYGRRGVPIHRDQGAVVNDTDAKKGSEAATLPELVDVLQDRIESLERDKQDLREELKIKNQQIADRVEREKETNALMRDLHTLMADSQQRLLPPPIQTPLPQNKTAFVDSNPPTPPFQLDEQVVAETQLTHSTDSEEKGTRHRKSSRHSRTKRRQKQDKSRRSSLTAESSVASTHSVTKAAPQEAKRRSLWSRMFSN